MIGAGPPSGFAHSHWTALFSNTPNAHRYKRTVDWVVVYFEKPGSPEGQCTVVTETRGPNTGKRVVRGHEPDMTTKEKDKN